jgi:hypothetical protein
VQKYNISLEKERFLLAILVVGNRPFAASFAEQQQVSTKAVTTLRPVTGSGI